MIAGNVVRFLSKVGKYKRLTLAIQNKNFPRLCRSKILVFRYKKGIFYLFGHCRGGIKQGARPLGEIALLFGARFGRWGIAGLKSGM